LRGPKEEADSLVRRNTKNFKERGIKWKGIRAIAPDCERWKALCKPSTPIGITGSTK
jgi:hypothetical protein